jgi:hypothetical protein
LWQTGEIMTVIVICDDDDDDDDEEEDDKLPVCKLFRNN